MQKKFFDRRHFVCGVFNVSIYPMYLSVCELWTISLLPDYSVGSHGDVLGAIQISSDYNPRLKLYKVSIVRLITQYIGLQSLSVRVHNNNNYYGTSSYQT